MAKVPLYESVVNRNHINFVKIEIQDTFFSRLFSQERNDRDNDRRFGYIFLKTLFSRT